MISIHEDWARRVANEYKGLNTKCFSFWGDFQKSLSGYCDAINSRAGHQLIVSETLGEWGTRVSTKMTQFEAVVDTISFRIHYSIFSPLLASLLKQETPQVRYGWIDIDTSGFYAVADCSPKLILNNSGHVLDLNEISADTQVNWKLSDIAARYFIKEILDARFANE
jgi:hypothetical protein